MPLVDHLQGILATCRARAALTLTHRQVTYGELEFWVRKARAWLADYGVMAGDRIAVQMAPSPESVVLLLAALFSEVVLVPLNPRYTAEETQYFLADSGAALYLKVAAVVPRAGEMAWDVLDSRRRDGLPAAVPRLLAQQISLLSVLDAGAESDAPVAGNPDATALLCYTSGTTGKPKAAVLTQRNLFATASSLHAAWGWNPEDVLLHSLPLFHVHGLLVALLGALYAGGRTVLLPCFEPELVLDLMGREGATIFMGVPTMFHRLLQVPLVSPPAWKQARLFVSGSAPLRPETFQGFAERFGHTILERYGMTETGMVLSNPLNGPRRPGSVGLPLPGVEVRIVNPETSQDVPLGTAGELLIRGPGVCRGYWGRPEADAAAFEAGGWFHSGDRACQDPDGYFRIVGRLKDLIIVGGFNVCPREVEEVLERHPDVVEAAVFGEPDPDLGERVCAAVVLRGDLRLGEAELLRFCKSRLTPYKCPRTIRFLDTLPRNAMGKVVKSSFRMPGPGEG